MLWILITLFSLLCLVPCWVTLFRKPVGVDAQQSSLRIYQSQLKELQNDFDNGLILQSEYQQAQLEIQRRLLKTDKLSATKNSSNFTISKSSLLVTSMGLLCIPCAAVGLYLINGVPSLPAAPLAPRLAEQQEMSQKVAPYVQQLRYKLSTLSPTDPKRIEGYLLLGKIEASQGDLPAAIKAWKEALNQQFDPNLAAQIAEIQTELDNSVSQDSVALFKKALETAPKDAPWRPLAEQRIGQYEKSHN